MATTKLPNDLFMLLVEVIHEKLAGRKLQIEWVPTPLKHVVLSIIRKNSGRKVLSAREIQARLLSAGIEPNPGPEGKKQHAARRKSDAEYSEVLATREKARQDAISAMVVAGLAPELAKTVVNMGLETVVAAQRDEARFAKRGESAPPAESAESDSQSSGDETEEEEVVAAAAPSGKKPVVASSSSDALGPVSAPAATGSATKVASVSSVEEKIERAKPVPIPPAPKTAAKSLDIKRPWGTKQCSKCDKFGHTAEECRCKLICFQCGKFGHKAVACTCPRTPVSPVVAPAVPVAPAAGTAPAVPPVVAAPAAPTNNPPPAPAGAATVPVAPPFGSYPVAPVVPSRPTTVEANSVGYVLQAPRDGLHVSVEQFIKAKLHGWKKEQKLGWMAQHQVVEEAEMRFATDDASDTRVVSYAHVKQDRRNVVLRAIQVSPREEEEGEGASVLHVLGTITLFCVLVIVFAASLPEVSTMRTLSNSTRCGSGLSCSISVVSGPILSALTIGRVALARSPLLELLFCIVASGVGTSAIMRRRKAVPLVEPERRRSIAYVPNLLSALLVECDYDLESVRTRAPQVLKRVAAPLPIPAHLLHVVLKGTQEMAELVLSVPKVFQYRVGDLGGRHGL